MYTPAATSTSLIRCRGSARNLESFAFSSCESRQHECTRDLRDRTLAVHTLKEGWCRGPTGKTKHPAHSFIISSSRKSLVKVPLHNLRSKATHLRFRSGLRLHENRLTQYVVENNSTDNPSAVGRGHAIIVA